MLPCLRVEGTPITATYSLLGTTPPSWGDAENVTSLYGGEDESTDTGEQLA